MTASVKHDAPRFGSGTRGRHPARARMGGMDRACARQEMVHAGALENGRLRNRPAPRRHLPHRDALAGGPRDNQRRLLPRDVPNRKLVWTVALQPGYRPSNPTFDIPAFTAIITLEPHGKGTKYVALAKHKDEESRNAHDRMGFSEGWGKALDQLVAHAEAM